MATFVVNVGHGVIGHDVTLFNALVALRSNLPGEFSNQSATGFRVTAPNQVIIDVVGSGFDLGPIPSTGTVTSIHYQQFGVPEFSLTDISKPLATLRGYPDRAAAVADLFAGADSITGSSGRDNLTGGPGSDTIAGGGDVDSISASDATTFVYVDFQDSPGFFYDGASFDVISGFEGASGGSAGDFLFGDAGVNTFLGDDGNDALLGRAGNDSLLGLAGDDLLMGGTAYDPTETGTGNDFLAGHEGSDIIYAMDGNDQVDGGADVDYVLGGAGNDNIGGGEGADFLFGGAAFDFNLADAGNDTITGGGGNDFIVAGNGADDISDGRGDDTVYCGGGADRIRNLSFSDIGGNDSIFGEDGADTIEGGEGFDYLYGGAGADTVVFYVASSYDTVWDFSVAEGDKLSLSLAFGVTSLAEFRARATTFVSDGRDFTRFTSTDGLDQITLGGVRPDQLTASNLELF